MNTLFSNDISVINAGLQSFADNIADAGAKVSSLSWQPPAAANHDGALIMARLVNDPDISAANQIALSRFLAAKPALVGVSTAGEALDGFTDCKRLLHAGPPIAWDDMCGPMQGALAGATVLEGWADTTQEAETLLAGGQIAYEPCHHFGAVGPMAGIISPSMPVWIIEDTASQTRHRSFSNFNEGLGKVLRFGANNDDVLTHLRWIASEVAPAMRAALKLSGEIDLKPLMAQALHMGDEVHNRNTAATGLLMKRLVPALLKTNLEAEVKSRVLDFVFSNDHFFLNLSMAACKNMLDAARDVPNASFVTVMARNGVNFGVQLSGTGDHWFQAPANPVNGLFFPGYDVEDAAADLGDSAITETAGIGGFAMAAAPAIVKFVGGTPADATHNSRKMREITVGANPAFTLPALNFAPTATGIDAIKVVDSSILPLINTGIAHRLAGVGQIGAGITTAPMSCFVDALKALTDARQTGAQ